jgi:hypothetical protein
VRLERLGNFKNPKASSRIKSAIFRFVAYKTETLFAVFWGFQAWSLSLRHECGLWTFTDRLLGGISGPDGDETNGDLGNFT